MMTIVESELKDCIKDGLKFIYSLNLTSEQEEKFKEYQKSLYRLILNSTLKLRGVL